MTTTPKTTATNETPETVAIRTPIPVAPAYGNIDPGTLVFKDDFAFIDTETTGLDPAVEAIVEIAVVRFRNGKPEVFHSLVNPGFPIPPGASAVHNIVDDDVKDAPTLESLRPKLEAMMEGCIRVAHNAKFDALYVDPAVGDVPDAKKWLCTYRLARHAMPEAPSFGNNVLRYWLKTKPKSEGLGAHRAIDDVYVSIENMRHCLKVCQDKGMTTLTQIQAYANEPIITNMIPFGKHVGKEFSEVPTDYFEWALLNMADLDADLKASMELEIAKRPDRNPKKFHVTGKAVEVAAADVMSFGKYAGRPLREIPSDYFQFLMEKGVRMEPDIKLGVDQELARRKNGPAASAQQAAQAAHAASVGAPAPTVQVSVPAPIICSPIAKPGQADATSAQSTQPTAPQPVRRSLFRAG